jgi:hypothetical protein
MRVALAAALLALLSMPSLAQLNKCTGPDGKTSYTDKPCASGTKEATVRDPTPGGGTSAPLPGGGIVEFQGGKEAIERAQAFKRFLDANGVPYRTEITSGANEKVYWQGRGDRDWAAEFRKTNPPTSSTTAAVPVDVPRPRSSPGAATGKPPTAAAESGGRIPGNRDLNVAYCIDGWYQVGSPSGRTRSSAAEQQEYANDCALFGLKMPGVANDAHNESVFRALKQEQDARNREQMEKQRRRQ